MGAAMHPVDEETQANLEAVTSLEAPVQYSCLSASPLRNAAKGRDQIRRYRQA
jgi:hypothetical protein